MYIVNVHEDLSANDTVERVGCDPRSVDEVGKDRDPFAGKNVKNIRLGNLVRSTAVHVQFLANLDAVATDIMSVEGEELLDVDTIDAMTPEPSKRGTVGFETAQLGEIGDAIEGQHGALGFQLLGGYPVSDKVRKKLLKEGNHRVNIRILAQRARKDKQVAQIADRESSRAQREVG